MNDTRRRRATRIAIFVLESAQPSGKIRAEFGKARADGCAAAR
jgi:hypothetical protein